MDKSTAITMFNIVSIFFGIYLMLTQREASKPKRRFLIGAICVLGGTAIASYQHAKF